MTPVTTTDAEEPGDRCEWTLVASGSGRSVSWRVYDCLQPQIGPQAVSYRLEVDEAGGGGGGGSGGGDRLRDGDEPMLEWLSPGGRRPRYRLLVGRCSPVVATARLLLRGEPARLLKATASAATGDHWVAEVIEPPGKPMSVDFLDDRGDVVGTLPLDFPVRRRRSR